MSYSFSQLESLWTGAGGSTTLAPVMAAIAMAESGGNAAAGHPVVIPKDPFKDRNPP